MFKFHVSTSVLEKWQALQKANMYQFKSTSFESAYMSCLNDGSFSPIFYKLKSNFVLKICTNWEFLQCWLDLNILHKFYRHKCYDSQWWIPDLTLWGWTFLALALLGPMSNYIRLKNELRAKWAKKRGKN